MSISIDGATSQVGNLKELFSQDLKAKNLDGTESGSSVVLNGDSVTISAREPASGETTARTVSASETSYAAVVEKGVQSMYASAAAVDEMADMLGAFAAECGLTPPAGGSTATVPKMSLGEVAEALNRQAAATTSEEIASGTTIADSTKTEDTFFDIYACMKLLQEVGQQERDAARELKQAELNTQVSSIMTQANKQREAGVLGALVSSVTMVAQVAMTAVSVTQSVKAVKSAYNTSAAQKTDVLESKAGSLQAQGEGPQATQKNLDKITAKTSPEAKAQVETALKEAGVPEAQSELKAAQLNEAKVTESVTNTTEENNAKIKELDSQIALAKEDLVPEMGADEPTPAAVDKLNDLITQKNDLVAANAAGEKTVAAAKERTVTADKNLNSAYDTAQKSVDANYSKASETTSRAENENIKNPSKANGKEAVACQQKQKTAGEASKLMAATVANDKAAMGIQPESEDIVQAQTAATQALKEMNGNPAFSQAQNRPWNVLFQHLPEMIGSLGHSCEKMATSLVEAEATEEQANQKTEEAYREESNQLMTQAQDLIASARDCCKAIMQAESQSIEQIIRA